MNLNGKHLFLLVEFCVGSPENHLPPPAVKAVHSRSSFSSMAPSRKPDTFFRKTTSPRRRVGENTPHLTYHFAAPKFGVMMTEPVSAANPGRFFSCVPVGPSKHFASRPKSSRDTNNTETL